MRRVSAISWSLSVFLLSFFFHLLPLSIWSEPAEPTPAEWPPKFNALLFENSSGKLHVIDFWYDWSRGGSLRITQNQLAKLTYERSWDNGTSYLYPSEIHSPCWLMHIPPGILRPNWMEGAIYHGQQYVDGFLCNVWEKVGVVWYYEDAVTKTPVHWSWIPFPGNFANLQTKIICKFDPYKYMVK